MPGSCPAWLATGLSAIHPCDWAPKIVQVFTIGEISPTWPQGNSLDRAFYDGLRLAFYVRNQDSCWNTKRDWMKTRESSGDMVVVHALDPRSEEHTSELQ